MLFYSKNLKDNIDHLQAIFRIERHQMTLSDNFLIYEVPSLKVNNLIFKAN